MIPTLSPTFWIVAAGLLIIGSLSLVSKIQTERLDSVTTAYAEFKAGVKVLGEAAQKAADKKAADDKSKKEKADAENKKAVADLAATIKRLRDERAGSSFLPPAAASARSPEDITLDRAKLEGAIRDLDQEVQGLVDEGSKAVIDLNTAKAWAQP